MKKIRKLKSQDAERIKYLLFLSKIDFEKELNNKDTFDEKAINAYMKKHKKAINDSFKSINIQSIIRRINANRT
jgi:hypothetical protein